LAKAVEVPLAMTWGVIEPEPPFALNVMVLPAPDSTLNVATDDIKESSVSLK
jgi:hypothetical protein